MMRAIFCASPGSLISEIIRRSAESHVQIKSSVALGYLSGGKKAADKVRLHGREAKSDVPIGASAACCASLSRTTQFSRRSLCRPLL